MYQYIHIPVYIYRCVFIESVAGGDHSEIQDLEILQEEEGGGVGQGSREASPLQVDSHDEARPMTIFPPHFAPHIYIHCKTRARRLNFFFGVFTHLSACIHT